MRLSFPCMVAVVALAVTTTATNLTSIVSKTPNCALQCNVQILPRANCPLLDPAPCFCTNITLQAEINVCVQQNCQFHNQTLAALALGELCDGYPKESRESYLKNVSIIMTSIASVALVLRLFSRIQFGNGLGADDYYATAAVVFGIISSVLEVISANLGLGRHYWNISPQQGPTLLKLILVLQIMYTLVITTSKLSLLAFYLRVFPNKKFRLMCNLGAAFVFVKGLTYVVLIIFQCSPVHRYWDLDAPGKCLSTNMLGLSAGFLTISEDLYILVLPIPVLNTLSIKIKQKIGLMAMFGVGILACITSMIRLRWAFKLQSYDYDKTWDYINILIWSVIEGKVMIICSCLPALWALAMRIYKSIWPTSPACKNLPSSDERYNIIKKKNCTNTFDDDVETTVQSRITTPSRAEISQVEPTITYNV